MSQSLQGDEPLSQLRLLFVCSANRCRSPMAEALARRTLHRRDIPAEVISAGRMSSGYEASPGAVDAMGRRDLDPGTLAAADLILVMEREHLIDVFEIQPTALERSFTLGEFPDLLVASADGATAATADPATRIRRAHEFRDRARILAVDQSTDIADPMGRRRGAYRRTARQLDHLIDATVDLLYPEQPD